MSESGFWLNVDFDKREYTCRLHRDNCSYILREATPYKGIGKTRRDGGWFYFETVEEAKAWWKDHYHQIPWKMCRKKSCFG